EQRQRGLAIRETCRRPQRRGRETRAEPGDPRRTAINPKPSIRNSKSPFMLTTWSFHSAGQLVFGRDATLKLGDLAGRFGAGRVFVVTDRALVKAGVVDRVQAPLAAAKMAVEVFDGGLPEPPIGLADECASRARAFEADAIVGLGGGSNLDLAKIVATILAQ